jgi:radical SAM superfamily enzyme YgiQ (UPF0313 family)
MRVLLISANTEQINMPTLPLGLALVAAATRRAGHEVRFLDLRAEPDPGASIGRAVEQCAPQVIGISVRNVDDQNMASPRFLLAQVPPVMAACRAAAAAPVIVGGAGYSIFPEAALRYLGADIGVCGDGEKAFSAILDCLEHGRDPAGIPGVCLPGHRTSSEPRFAENLDDLPLPGEELWRWADPQDADVWIPVQTRRGCSFDCSYCSTPNLEGRRLRIRSPETVARHIARVAEAGFRRFYFVDNTFNLPPSYALRLCGCLESLPVRVEWRAILYPHAVSEELVRAMAQSGCVEVALGFESGNMSVLKAMNKRFTPEEVRGISQALMAHGIRRTGFLLLGGPGETMDSVEESLTFAESLQLDLLSVRIGIRIYPHTRLARIAIEEGVVLADDDLLRPRFYVRAGMQARIEASMARRGLPVGLSQPGK